MNAALALIEGVAPKNEIEGALAIQMACSHSAALSVLARFRGGGGGEHRVVALATAAARLQRAFSVQVETLRRLRHGGDQYVRVEHVHVNEWAGRRRKCETASAGSLTPLPSGSCRRDCQLRQRHVNHVNWSAAHGGPSELVLPDPPP